MWRFWAPPHTPSLNILLAFFWGGGRRVKYCLNKVHGVLFYQMFLFFIFFGSVFVFWHNLLQRCGPSQSDTEVLGFQLNSNLPRQLFEHLIVIF